MGYLFLTLAICGELIGTNLLKASNGFSVLWASVGALAAYGVCFYFLAIAMKTINISVVYAIWAGVGIVLTAVLNVVIWRESLNIPTLLGLMLIVVGAVILNLYGPGH
ncbi:DMT family transporter [Eupransor demetentiae]|uniref:Multidrug transporter EmrE and related cation transporters (EmrE) n=1 Tax=Eupransor demetentiae TaxID=3109584 RepID=A0ABP0ESU7_9LACO|nr:Multidrug transporter EmrE and related cation transporters (EmrE) [Lactobacillaceae bacterium LMG 33000]